MEKVKLYLFVISPLLVFLAFEALLFLFPYKYDATKQEQIIQPSYSDISEKIDKKPTRRITNLEKGLIESGEKVKFSGHVFIKRDESFDPKYVDGSGRSNIERMKEGLAPIGKDGKQVELHHMKQREDGIIVELSNSEHAENTKTFHRYTPESEIDREKFGKLRKDYWKNRAKDF